MTGPHIPHPRPPLEPITAPLPVNVGDQRDRGSVHASLMERGGEQRLVVNVACMVGLTVDISLDDAADLYRGLGRLLGLS
jgi:hypothetical protein